jgi:haloacetate dehalogenase
MVDLADLFPGYRSEWINTKSGRVFARVGGKGPPLLLLHGFSSTHVMWHKVAPLLEDRFTLIIADLPGYGWSDMPESDKAHTPYTKRAMANTMIDAMERLGYVHFATIAAAACRIGSRSIIPAGCPALPCSIFCRPTITGSA